MRQASRKQEHGSTVADRIASSIREAVIIGALIITVCLLIALMTYHPDDPGWSNSMTTEKIHNNLGPVGAWIADVLLYFFGYCAYFFPLLILISGWRLFHLQRCKARFDQFLFFIRSLGVIVGFIGGCGIAWMHFQTNDVLPHEDRGTGGILGDIAGTIFLEATGEIGSTLLLLTMFIIGITLYTSLSWLRLMETTGQLTLTAIAAIRHKIMRFGDMVAGWRAKRSREHFLRQERQYEEQRTPPEIEIEVPKIKTGIRAIKEKQEPLFIPSPDGFLPPLKLLDGPAPGKAQYSKEALGAMSRQVEMKLKDFNVSVKVAGVRPGPVVTRFELDPAPGVKGSQISSLARDLARSLAVMSVRVVDVIPGRPYIGLEIPNENRELVTLGEILNSREYEVLKSPLALALGKDIGGKPVVADLAKMPHLLVAGTTGSGKSVALNAMILSLLYKAVPAEVRLIMIDPKMLELSVYEGIPNLLAPVVTDMKKAINALRWCVSEMERRYESMSLVGVRNITAYNKKVSGIIAGGGDITGDSSIFDPSRGMINKTVPLPRPEKLPCIVIIIDELADMMMVVGKKVEELITRLAQKARAAGIHLILATQRPSVDVITGLIKANVPSRIAFQVSSRIDSRTILDQSGAEYLLGHGDMLFLPGGVIPERVHGAFVSDNEVSNVVRNLKKQGVSEYIEEILSDAAGNGENPIHSIDSGGDETDPLYDEAVRIVTETRRVSISYIQRRLKVGYNRAARMVEEMENSGVVGPLESNGGRQVLAGRPPPVN